MQIIIDIFTGLTAIVMVLLLFLIGRGLRIGLEESEWYNEDF